MRSGNGWVTFEQEHQHWGLFGAAGLLVYVAHPDDPSQSPVLMQHRARWSHQGGTWALPGGAMDEGETPAEPNVAERTEIPLSVVGRIGAQTVKQVMIQLIRQDERGSIYDEYKDRVGTIIPGTAVTSIIPSL